MKDLALHIEYLLLHTDCVIVPRLGGFIAQLQESTRSEAEQLFLPPVRLVRFNASLCEDMNDTLITSMTRIYNINRFEAERRLSECIQNFNNAIETEGTVDFGSLGVFAKENGELTFSPCEAGATTPDYYGLDTFVMPQLKPEEMIVEKKPVRISSVKADDKQITISLNRRLVNYAATIAASVVMFVMFNTTLDSTSSTDINNQTAALTLPVDIAPKAKQTTIEASIVPEQTDAKAEAKSEEPKAEAPAPITVRADKPLAVEEGTCGKYVVVLKSGFRMKRGGHYVRKMMRLGFDNARLITIDHEPYVAIVGFTSAEAANQCCEEANRNKGVSKATVRSL